MKKTTYMIPILAGLAVGQLFAEGDRPLSVVNTLRFGYNDNLYYEQNAADESAYVEDIVDLAFAASLSEQTDLTVKAQLSFRTDEETNLHPSLYAVLNHAATPRMLLSLSEYFKSSDRPEGQGGSGGRYNYFDNKAGVSGTYVVNDKNRLEMSADHSIRRHESDFDDADYTTVGATVSWARDIQPEKTSVSLNLHHQMTEYDNRDDAYDATDLSVGLTHAFNPKLQGNIELGGTYVQPDLPSPAVNDSHVDPLIVLGLTYSPSPSTQVTGSYSERYSESTDNRYGGQTSRTFALGIQHDLTAKISATASARKSYSEYEADDSNTAGGSSDEEQLDLDLRISYKLNRINFLEAGISHSEADYEGGSGDWDQNMVDVGWRIEL